MDTLAIAKNFMEEFGSAPVKVEFIRGIVYAMTRGGRTYYAQLTATGKVKKNGWRLEA